MTKAVTTINKLGERSPLTKNIQFTLYKLRLMKMKNIWLYTFKYVEFIQQVTSYKD